MINEAECVAAGLDPKKVASIARRIEKAAIEAEEMGILIFGGTRFGHLRYADDQSGRYGDLILAHIQGLWSGGCGAACEGPDGLLRGEP